MIVTQPRFNAADVWEKLGITEHLGGSAATQRLARCCILQPGDVVLDLGCGTGYSACLLAQQYGLRVVAVDRSAAVLQRARERIAAAGVGQQVSLVQADLHALNFPAAMFDAVIAESVLVFCDQPRALAEIHRVLKPGGFFGSNELTFLASPPPEWKKLLSSAYFDLTIQPRRGEEWFNLFEQAGFGDVSAVLQPLSLQQQFANHIRVDGWRRYFAAVVRGLADPGARAAFLTPTMLRAWRAYPRYVGYGLYVGRKPETRREVWDRNCIPETLRVVL